jgi:hypothetical protein
MQDTRKLLLGNEQVNVEVGRHFLNNHKNATPQSTGLVLGTNMALGTTLIAIGVQKNAWLHGSCVCLLGQASRVLLT